MIKKIEKTVKASKKGDNEKYEGSILSLVTFYIFMNDLDAAMEGILSKFADDTKLGGAVDYLRGRETLQGVLDKLNDWAVTNHTKLNKGKRWILHLGQDNRASMQRMENEMLESSTAERDLGILVDGKLNMGQQCPGSQEGHLCPGVNQAQL
ncbi:hypothetical protein TURU_121268 [Turdus rufiventris]|nr:hypothetical protein TURU_121268 [Turdus rufiventris]